MEMECKRSGQIPVFGDWDNANEMPITQYFECARQAGLIRHSCHSSLEENNTDLYALHFHKPHFYAIPNAPQRKTKAAINKKRCPEQKWTGKVEKLKKDSGPTMKSATVAQRPTNPKPVDEDLYKIPPHLLPGYKRKRMFGFFSRCLAPPCKA
ncbi:uncharacterized protein LOC107810558 [Nicotiana tabacum]|uniref:Uncharacterized protein LOC107810558 n=2 Tax=Nicotiana TaxID=4085 RepID=A0A1S4BPS5_TOBAC|nr:PREDICTED: uncharacterized protein LOC104229044 [Nicotiana sylvestris]XP_016490838.1 PREDICTED: uncharacterized protein LOC107810558 [Nicotiana tabacum]